MNKYIVYYCYLTTKYKQLIDKQFQRLVDSGLYDEVVDIYVNICGEEELVKQQIEYFKQYDKVKIYSINSVENTYEYQGLKCVYDIAETLNNDDIILYFHTKGISRNCSLDMELWRNVMEYELIDNRDNIMKMFDYKTCGVMGVNLKTFPKFHFSGNFWWAKVWYLNNLVEPKKVIDDEYVTNGITGRHYYEFWISHFKDGFDGKMNMKGVATYDVDYYHYNEFEFLNKKYFV